MEQKQGVKEGGARFIGMTPGDEKVIHGEVYPCLITPQGNIIIPEKYGDYPFTPGISFEIVDLFLVNIDKILK